jgi:hypothetical protein
MAGKGPDDNERQRRQCCPANKSKMARRSPHVSKKNHEDVMKARENKRIRQNSSPSGGGGSA